MYRTFLVLFSFVCLAFAEWTTVLERAGIQLVAPLESQQVEPGFLFLANDSLFLFKNEELKSIHPDLDIGNVIQLGEGYALSDKGVFYFDTQNVTWRPVSGFEDDELYKIESEREGTRCYVLTETMVVQVDHDSVTDTIFVLDELKDGERYKYIHDFDVKLKSPRNHTFSVVTGGVDFIKKELFYGKEKIIIWQDSLDQPSQWSGTPPFKNREIFVGLTMERGNWITILNGDTHYEYCYYEDRIEMLKLNQKITSYSHVAIDYYASSDRLLTREFPLLIGMEHNYQIHGVTGEDFANDPFVKSLKPEAHIVLYGMQIQNLNSMIAWDDSCVYHFYTPPVSVEHIQRHTLQKGLQTTVSQNRLLIKTELFQGTVSLYNLQGRKLLSQSFTQNGVVTLDVSTVSSGSYMLQIDGDGVLQSRKVMIP